MYYLFIIIEFYSNLNFIKNNNLDTFLLDWRFENKMIISSKSALAHCYFFDSIIINK